MKRLITVLMLLLGVFSVFAICACENNTVNSSHEHVYGEWKTQTEATCDKEGVRVRTCSCGEKEEEKIPAKGHVFSEEYTTDTQPTCSTEGKQSKHCTRPGCKATTDEISIPTIDHIFGNWEEVRKPTCTEVGKSERKCYNCDFKESKDIDALGHDFQGTEVTKEPTCTEDGIQIGGVCSRCQTPGDEVPIPKLGHDFNGDKEVLKEPSCTEPGEEKVQCTRCDEETTQTIPKLGHNYLTKERGEPNSCGDRKTTYECSRCHDTMTDIVDGDNHQWSEFRFFSGAYCSAEGKKEVRTCTVCGRDNYRSTPRTGNHFSGTLYYVYREPTETTEGIRYKLCSTCGEIMNETRETIPVLKPTTENITYSVQVCRDISSEFKFNNEMTVKVYDENNQEVGNQTTQNALATFSLPAKNYTVKLEGLPEGYIAKEGGYTLTPAMPQINAEVSAAVIKEGEINEKGYYQEGDVIHDFSFKDYDGVEYKMSELLAEHKFVVLDYYYTTCQFCNNEFRVEKTQDLDNRYGGDILFVYICGQDRMAESKASVEKHAAQYNLKGIFVDGEGSQENKTKFKTYFANHVNNTVKDWGYPTRIVIDHQGVYTYVSRADTGGTMYVTYDGLLTRDRIFREKLFMPDIYKPADPVAVGE